MKLDKRGKAWAKICAFITWSLGVNLLGGLYSPWVPSATIEEKVWITAFSFGLALLFGSLGFFTEEES